MLPMEDAKKSKWNWPYKSGAAVAQGFEKAKEKGLLANAYDAIQKSMQMKNQGPTGAGDVKN